MTVRSSYAKRNAKTKNATIAVMRAALPKISNEVNDHFVTGPMLTGEAVSAATMGGGLAHHLGYASGAGRGGHAEQGDRAQTLVR